MQCVVSLIRDDNFAFDMAANREKENSPSREFSFVLADCGRVDFVVLLSETGSDSPTRCERARSGRRGRKRR